MADCIYILSIEYSISIWKYLYKYVHSYPISITNKYFGIINLVFVEEASSGKTIYISGRTVLKRKTKLK